MASYIAIPFIGWLKRDSHIDLPISKIPVAKSIFKARAELMPISSLRNISRLVRSRLPAAAIKAPR
jgi:hypothetical protein